MPTTPEGFHERLTALKRELIAQGRRVQAMVEAAFDAVFARDAAAARRAIDLDTEIDRVDVELEKSCVALLGDACGAGCVLAPAQLRMVLTVVKINNELERIADVGVSIAEEARLFSAAEGTIPPTFRVLANSLVGIIRDATTSLERTDAELARVVLLSEEAVAEFKKALIRDSQDQLSKGRMSLEFAMVLGEVATFCQVIADHCTNIAEQIMYVATGTIVRHMEGHWEEVALPGDAGRPPDAP
ncbi:MAG: phosphate uptake regulator PhoU [Phycisphaerales bacterium]